MKPRRLKHASEADEWVLIGGCNGSAETVERIQFVFRPNGIELAFEGSILYDVYARTADMERATELLRVAQRMSLRDDVRVIPPSPVT